MGTLQEPPKIRLSMETFLIIKGRGKRIRRYPDNKRTCRNDLLGKLLF